MWSVLNIAWRGESALCGYIEAWLFTASEVLIRDFSNIRPGWAKTGQSIRRDPQILSVEYSQNSVWLEVGSI